MAANELPRGFYFTSHGCALVEAGKLRAARFAVVKNGSGATRLLPAAQGLGPVDAEVCKVRTLQQAR
ncbi:Hypothetical protein A7982_06667 [Minicystis rosea]|nr:Hypothetical protein A7982_06667 [Minicystis rosea]